jgi:hypothetical protein
MSDESHVELGPGDRVIVRVGVEMVMTLVEEIASPTSLRVRVSDGGFDGDVLARFVDRRGDAWRASAVATAGDEDPSEVVLELEESWKRDTMRQSQRVSGARHSLRGEAQAGSLAPGIRLDMICLDISASGCRASGVGRAPREGDLIRLTLQHPFEDARDVLARVMRAQRLSFGRYELGFRFEADAGSERAWLAAWRDAWAYASQVEDAPDDAPADTSAASRPGDGDASLDPAA